MLGVPFGTAASPDPALRCGENSRPERYITDSKTAAKPSSDFTIHGRQSFPTHFLVNLLQTNQIELQNFLHWPRTLLAILGLGASVE
jgi:hypothetical protein